MLPKILKRAKKASKETLEVKPTKNLPPKGSLLRSLNQSLGVVFYFVWILIGLFLIILIITSVRQGGLKNLFSPSTSTPSTSQQDQTPTEVSLPGIGVVNVACVQNALTPESIQKIVQDQNTSGLTADEKAKFEPCIVQKETPTPSVKPSPTSSPKPTS